MQSDDSLHLNICRTTQVAVDVNPSTAQDAVLLWSCSRLILQLLASDFQIFARIPWVIAYLMASCQRHYVV